MHDVIDVDGVRVLFGDGWGLIRASNTQPVLVARYEARTPGTPLGDSAARWRGGCAARASRCRVPGRRWLILLVAGAAVTLLVGRAIAQIYTDYLWYSSMGAADVWRARYSSLVLLRSACAIAATLFVFANLYAVRQSVVSLVLPRRIGNIDIGEEVPRRQLTYTAAGLALLIGLVLAWSHGDWSRFLALRVGRRFGEADPYFATDLSFFVYRLPFEISLFNWTMTMVLLVVALVVALYALTPSLRWESGGLYVSGYVRRHLTMLAGVLLIVLAWHYRLEMYRVLGHGSGTDGAFSFIDHRVSIPASLLLSLVTLGAGLTVLWAGWTGQVRLAFAALTGVIIAVLAGRQLAPFVVKRATANRDPAVRERPYEGVRAGYTRRAFAVDRIAAADSGVVFASLEDAAANVPVWDDGALRRASDRALGGASVGWSASDSGVIAIVPTQVAGGSVATYIASATEDNGTPARALRLEASVEMPAVNIAADSNARPLVVADSLGMIAGAPLTSGIARFAHALSMQDFRLWFGALPSPAPRIVARASVRDRVRALAPFFAQGTTISPIWHADSLVWALELYSASATYPLSRRILVAGEERSYFQHAATALLNATTGRLKLVADSVPDPIADTWMKRFPGLFVRSASLPVTVRRQMQPARESARAQATAFGRYGLRGDTVVQRFLPGDEGPDSALAATPAPVLAFPRLGTTGYVLPLLDRTERLRGLLIALGGPAHRTLWLPAGENAPIWSEALDRLRAADTLSASQLVRGYVRPIPLAHGVALAQPRYDWRGGGAPRLMYVPTLEGDSVRSARTLLQLVGRFPDTARMEVGDLRVRARRLYEEMRRASLRGDWAAYGRAFDALGALLSAPTTERRP